MAQSWYVENQCIDVKELQPISLVFISTFIQTLISALILSRQTNVNSSKNITIQLNEMDVPLNENLNDRKSEGAIIKGKCTKWGMLSLVCWQFVSVLLILIMDIMKIVDKLSLIETGGWDRYQCMAAIFLTSSNAKTLLSYATIVAMLDESDEGGSPTETYHAMKDLFCRGSKLKMVFIICCSMLGMMESFVIVPYMVGPIVYIWIPLTLAFVFFCILGLFANASKRLKESLLEIDFDSSELLMMTCSLCLVILMIIFGLSLVNLYSGIDYWNSFWFVMSERKWNDYFAHVVSNLEQGFRFITWIL